MATNDDIQQWVNSKTLGKVVIPDGEYSIYNSVRLHDGIVVEGESKNGTVLDIRGNGKHAFSYASGAYTRSHIGVRNMTIRTQYAGNCGVYAFNSGADEYTDLVFQGVDRTVHLDGGLGHSIARCKVESWGGQRVGSLILESTYIAGYCQYNSIEDYQTYFASLSAPIILRRATNAHISGYMAHAPGQPGIIIDDDCQGIVLESSQLIGCTNGVLIQSRNGRSPQSIDIRDTHIDQNSAAGIAVYGGSDVRVSGGEISNGFQGVEIGGYPVVERVHVSTDILGQQNNGVVIMAGGKWFDVKGCRISASGGAAIVVSGGQSNYYEISGNDVSQRNRGGGVYDFSSPVPGEPSRRVVGPNILP